MARPKHTATIAHFCVMARTSGKEPYPTTITIRKDTEDACFFSAASVQRPKTFANTDEGRDAEINYRLGTQLPYMFII